MHAWRDRVEFPELKKQVTEFAAEWKPNVVLIEDKASGQSLIQELRRDTNLPIIPVKIDKDTITRASAVTALVEAGKVLLPEKAGWLDAYLEELSTFPSSAHDDFVDSTTQALNYIRGQWNNAFEFLRLRAEKIQAEDAAADSPDRPCRLCSDSSKHTHDPWAR